MFVINILSAHHVHQQMLDLWAACRMPDNWLSPLLLHLMCNTKVFKIGGCLARTYRPSTSHICSIEDMSRDLAGQGKKRCVTLLWNDSNSCPVGMHRHLEGQSFATSWYQWEQLYMYMYMSTGSKNRYIVNLSQRTIRPACLADRPGPPKDYYWSLVHWSFWKINVTWIAESKCMDMVGTWAYQDVSSWCDYSCH